VFKGDTSYWNSQSRDIQEQLLKNEKRKQPGIAFPSPRKQEYILIIRLDIAKSHPSDVEVVRRGLKKLCNFFDRIDRSIIKIDELTDNGEIVRSPISKYNFTATVGFGIGFFEKLNIDPKNRPRRLYAMPNHIGLHDPIPQIMSQTDMIIQLCSRKEFVNRWVFQNDVSPVIPEYKTKDHHPKSYYSLREKNNVDNQTNVDVQDIVTAVRDWVIVTDVHAGFQRLDGRNLMGFNDGISNPDRLQNDYVWTTKGDENEKFKDGTYMVFQKIEHDLEQWRKLRVTEQQRWIGRSKGTGLLLGTLAKDEDEKLASDCRSDDPHVRKTAIQRLRNLLDKQSDPEKRFFDSTDPMYNNIHLECPVWSHVRKANPRGVGNIGKKIIFRRGYLFMDNSLIGKVSSGLLFICFQRDINNGFEYIKKNFLNNKNFPVPEVRNFTNEELAERHRHARFSEDELKKLGSGVKATLGLDSKAYGGAVEETRDTDSQNTGRDGLAGPSQLGIKSRGEFLATVPLGGGYYFIPPIPNKNISDIGEQFFV
jgi:Dyp-type peroxidase family